jgi:hypothetical protein
MRRTSYDQGFHTYALEWTEDWLRVYVDTRLHHTLNLRFDTPFFARSDFPTVTTNGSAQVVTPNPWANASAPNTAPFDQRFHLELDVAVGTTNGWFPDGVGGKPWIDHAQCECRSLGSPRCLMLTHLFLDAMRDFAAAQSTWLKSWPSGDSVDDRAMIVDSVKMWSYCT